MHCILAVRNAKDTGASLHIRRDAVGESISLHPAAPFTDCLHREESSASYLEGAFRGCLLYKKRRGILGCIVSGPGMRNAVGVAFQIRNVRATCLLLKLQKRLS
ncbi:uncharacterized protein AKAW2_20048A [Aspergillus luchuensis]|uniref:Uncharacterized protein n=1 Tax=Aspergillus kawachii TaxID=1069201 RepID=A0A7R7W338_ASPKA|nr:uncharacterized protein AKAW2_20048A [Aspergillus luchuensis]BCR95108.1 hypothetical protein AKAW2_20048A [Aspergillus luchuensis]